MTYLDVTDLTGNFIKKRIEFADLEEKLFAEQTNGKLVGGEHCFRKSSLWYHLNVGYTNRINFGQVHAELALISSSMNEQNTPLSKALIRKQQVFYGVGVGDTEIAFVDWAIKLGQKDIFVTGIDVNVDFLENYVIALRNRTYEPDKPTINFRGYHALFEQISTEDLQNTGHRPVHLCLGGTIGNFLDQETIIRMFSHIVKTGEKLILGIQLDYNIDFLFQKYKNNLLYEDFVLNYVPKSKRSSVRWIMDKKTGFITAIHEDIEVFRTRKYNPNKLRNLVENHCFSLKYQIVDQHNNSCIQLYERI